MDSSATATLKRAKTPQSTLQLSLDPDQGPIFSGRWHPAKPNLFAAACINGNVDFFDLERAKQSSSSAGASDSILARRKRHKGAVRDLAFSPDAGAKWVSVSSDKTALLSDTETNARIFRRNFDAAVNVVRFYNDATSSSSSTEGSGTSTAASIQQQRSDVFVCGLDDGSLHFVDTRERPPSNQGESHRTRPPTLFLHEQEDFISDLLLLHDKGQLAATSGDGTLGVFDLRKRKLFALSDPQDDELLSLARCKGGRKLLVGAQRGDCKVFSVDDYGDCKDRIVLDAHRVGQRDSALASDGRVFGTLATVDDGAAESGAKQKSGAGKNNTRSKTAQASIERVSTDALCNVGDLSEYALAAGSDGAIRLLAVHSQKHGNRVVAKLGLHSEMGGLESLAQNPHNAWEVATCGHDGVVKIWDFGEVVREICSSKKGAGEEAEGEAPAARKKQKKGKTSKSKVLDLASAASGGAGALVARKNNFWGGLGDDL